MNYRGKQQYSLVSLFAMLTVLCILFAFIKADRCFGVIATVVCVGIAAAAVSIRHRNFTVAYLVSAFTCGVLVYFVAAFLLCFPFWDDFPNITSSLCFGGASLLSTVVLRMWWRGEEFPILYQALTLTYASPAVFLVIANFANVLRIPGSAAPELTFLCVVGCWYWTTLSIFFVFPLWLFVASALNAIDEMEHRWIQEMYDAKTST